MTTDRFTGRPAGPRPTPPPRRPAGDRRLIVVSNREPCRRVEEDDDTVWKRTTGGLVSALDEALAMPPEQQARWMRSARRQVLEHDVRRWLDSVLAAAAQGVETWAA
jgi:trehalose-6-phosphate synthase